MIGMRPSYRELLSNARCRFSHATTANPTGERPSGAYVLRSWNTALAADDTIARESAFREVTHESVARSTSDESREFYCACVRARVLTFASRSRSIIIDGSAPRQHAWKLEHR